MFFIIALVFFCALALAGVAITDLLKRRDEAEETIKTRLGTQTGVEIARHGGGKKQALVKDLRLSSIEFLNDFLTRVSIVAKLAKLMRQAGMNRRVGEVILYIPLLGSIAFLAGLLVLGSAAAAVPLGVLGSLFPIIIVSKLRAKRIKAFSEQLPDALDLVRAALQAGHSLISAFKIVADEFPDPIAAEFDTVAEEMKLGLPIREALQGLQDRVEDPNVPVLVVGVLVVQESGGNLAEVLDNVAHTVRERFKLLRDTEVMTAQGKLSGGMLTCLPIIVAGLLFSISPEYFDAMLEKETGHYLIGYAIFSIIVGHLMIQRIVRIKV
jgi:tight adherence protein B